MADIATRLRVVSGAPLTDWARGYVNEAADAIDAVEAALFSNAENDVSHNLQGALHDLQNQFDPKDGGVCATTVRRAIEQLELARTALKL